LHTSVLVNSNLRWWCWFRAGVRAGQSVSWQVRDSQVWTDNHYAHSFLPTVWRAQRRVRHFTTCTYDTWWWMNCAGKLAPWQAAGLIYLACELKELQLL